MGARDPADDDVRTCVVDRYRAYLLVEGWAPRGGRLTCLGVRGVSMLTADPSDLDPPVAERVYYDDEDSLRAAIDATYETPAEASLWRGCEAPTDPADVAAAMAAEDTT